MTRGVREGRLIKADLVERLKLPHDDNYKLKDLLDRALKEGKLTNEELQASLPTSNSVIKCYLYSVVDSNECRNALETYVQVSSQLYSRGTFILNLIADHLFGSINISDDIPKFDFDVSRYQEFYDFIENKNMFKQCMLPERFPTSKLERSPFIENILSTCPQINELLPSWRTIMNVSGWDNAINRMASKYHANIMNHVSVHLKDNIRKYLNKVNFEINSPRSLINDLFNRQIRPFIMSNEAFEHVIELRNYFNCKKNDYMFKSFDYEIKSFGLMMFLVKHGVTEGTYLPISTVGRKYCYVDEKISKYLLKDVFNKKKQELGKDPTFSELFGINPETFRKKRKLIRQRLRRKYKTESRILKKKWNRLGCSNMPKNARICSFETDGVGISICIQRPIALHTEQKDEELQLNDPAMVGIDIGRAKLFTASISTNSIKKPISYAYTRRQYYRDMKHKFNKRFEEQRSQRPIIASTLNTLSANGGKKNIQQYTQSVSSHFETLKREYIEDKERALWRMRMYRLKKRALDKAVQCVIERCGKKDIVIGIGDAGVLPTGPREKSMPTNQIVKVFLKAKYKQKTRKIKIVSINEFKTTVCCCACGCDTSPFILNNGSRSRRLRLCTECIQGDPKRRDRDVQAARNMLWLTQYMHLGCERPWYLCRQPKTTS